MFVSSLSRVAIRVAVIVGSASLAGCVSPLDDLPNVPNDSGVVAPVDGGGTDAQVTPGTDGSVVPGSDAAPGQDGAVSPGADAAPGTDGSVAPGSDAAVGQDAATPADGGTGGPDAADAGPPPPPPCSQNSECGANGLCVNNACTCTSGFTWVGAPAPGSCVDTNECTASATNPCGSLAGAACVNVPNGGGYTCTCPAGYEAKSVGGAVTCVDVDECVAPSTSSADAGVWSDGGAWSNPCGAGTCGNLQGTYQCSCPAGYQASTVNGAATCANVNECTGGTNPCGYGTCQDTPGSYTCACQAGYAFVGGTCVDVNECTAGSSNPCGVGTCQNGQGTYACNCPSGYQSTQGANGPTCADIDECGANPSLCAPGSCGNTAGSFTCTCGNGYRLSTDGRSCLNIDECAESPYLCATGAGTRPAGQCVDTPGSFYCACPNGYQAASGNQSCVDVDECAQPGRCGQGQYCVNTLGSYSCNSCPAGQAPSGGGCADVNECTAGSQNPCGTMVGAQCTNLVNTGYSCTCPTGYVSTGGANPQCVDVNECNTNNGGCSQTCSNTQGGFTCSCNTGYQLAADGKTCNDVNECLANNGGCSAYATCTNTTGGRTCTCQSGYSGDGVSCTDVDECASGSVCGATSTIGTCSNQAGTYTCSCGAGYQFRNGTCVNVDECTSGTNPCGAGTCSDTQGAYSCQCQSGYQLAGSATAPTCTDTNECSTNNGGCQQTCTNTTGSYACGCNAYYTLASDQKSCTDVNECNSSNGGCSAYATCTNNTGAAPTCTCQSGYTSTNGGVTCTDVNECTATADVCGTSAAGSCQNTAGSYQCSCNAGYSLQTVNGVTKCLDANECSSATNPCGVGSCTNTGGSYACACPNYYTAGTNGSGQPTCVDVDECANNTAGCSQYASCTNNVGAPPTCACNSGRIGDGFSCQTFANVVVGDDFQCVRTVGDNARAKVYCWGDNTYGQLGDGTYTTRNYPSVTKPVDWSSAYGVPATAEPLGLWASGRYACATLSMGQGAGTTAACWGDNSKGQLGANASGVTKQNVAVRVRTGTASGVTDYLTATALALGRNHACGYVPGQSTQAYCWGDNSSGQLGAGTSGSSVWYYALPTVAQTFTNTVSGTTFTLTYSIKEMAASEANTCAILTDGQTTPTLVMRCAGATAAATPASQVIPTITSATVTGAGCNVGVASYAGACMTQLAYAVPAPSNFGTLLGALTGGAGHFSVVGKDSSGSVTIYSWGLNGNYQFGNGTTTNSTTPQAASMSNFSGSVGLPNQLFAGTRNTFAISNGSSPAILSTGDCSSGQCGNGSAGQSGVYGQRAINIRGAGVGIDRTCVLSGTAAAPSLTCSGADTGSGSKATLGTTPIGGSAPTNKYFNPVYWN